MMFLTFLVFLAVAYFMYNISETLIDIKDELRAANRNQEAVNAIKAPTPTDSSS